MNIFDFLQIASKVPWDVVQKLEADAPKFQQLIALWKEAEPHVQALLPLEQKAVAIWDSMSPEVQGLLQALRAAQ